MKAFPWATAALLLGIQCSVGQGGTNHHSLANSQPISAHHTVTVWLDWFPNPDHVGIYVAIAEGFYARLGIDVHVRIPANPAQSATLLAHGVGDIGISYEPQVLLDRAANVPVVATGAIVQRALDCIMTLKSSGITRPRQLQGKIVAVAGLSSDYADLTAVMQRDGADIHKVRIVAVNYDLQQALLSKRVDAVEGVYWTWEALQADESGHPVNVMRLDQYGVPPYDELVFITGNQQLHNEAGLLRAFQEATFKGYEFAVAHPGEATSIMLKVPGVLSKSRGLIEHSIKLLSSVFHDTKGHYGTMSVASWQAYADWMNHTRPQALMNTRLDVRSAITTKLLP